MHCHHRHSGTVTVGRANRQAANRRAEAEAGVLTNRLESSRCDAAATASCCRISVARVTAEEVGGTKAYMRPQSLRWQPRATASRTPRREAITAALVHPPTLSMCSLCVAHILSFLLCHAGMSGSFDAGAKRAQQFQGVAADAATAAHSQTDAVGHFTCDSGGQCSIDGICGRITRTCSELTRCNSGARCVAQRKWGSGRFSCIRLVQRLFPLSSSSAGRCKPPAAASTTAATTTGRDESSAVTFRKGGHSLSVRSGSQRQQFASAFFVRRRCCCCGIQLLWLEWQKRPASSGAD